MAHSARLGALPAGQALRLCPSASLPTSSTPVYVAGATARRACNSCSPSVDGSRPCPPPLAYRGTAEGGLSQMTYKFYVTREGAPLRLWMLGTNLYSGVQHGGGAGHGRSWICISCAVADVGHAVPCIAKAGREGPGCLRAPRTTLCRSTSLPQATARTSTLQRTATGSQAQCVSMPSTCPMTHLWLRFSFCTGGHKDEYIATYYDWQPGPVPDEAFHLPDGIAPDDCKPAGAHSSSAAAAAMQNYTCLHVCLHGTSPPLVLASH